MRNCGPERPQQSGSQCRSILIRLQYVPVDSERRTKAARMVGPFWAAVADKS